jgi:hypothetical protein
MRAEEAVAAIFLRPAAVTFEDVFFLFGILVSFFPSPVNRMIFEICAAPISFLLKKKESLKKKLKL